MQSTARFSLINCYNFATNCRFFQCRFVAVKNVVNETLQGLIDDTKRFVLCVNWRSSFWKSHCLKSQLVGFYENVRTLHKMLFVFFFRYHEFFLREFSIEFSWIISKTAVQVFWKIPLSLDLWSVQVSLQRDSERQCNFSLLLPLLKP